MADYVHDYNFHYTYADYLLWPADERWELIYGVPYNMSPSPTRRHQQVLLNIATKFVNFLEGKPCRPYIAPFDVRLPEQGESGETVSTVVQPDLSVFCDENKLDAKGATGAPDLIVEILSPSTGLKDVREKFYLYEQHGVKEYWLVHPTENWVEILKRGEDGRLSRREVYGSGDQIEVELFPGLVIDLDDVLEIPEKENRPAPKQKASKE